MQASKRVLLVDGDPSSRRRIASILAPPLFECHEAQTAREALNEARRERPDVILLDSYLADLSGLGLCRLIRETPALARTPVILVSAQASEIDRVLAFEAGADDFVSKPFYAPELAARVAAVLRGFASSEASAQQRVAGRVTIDVARGRAEVSGEPLDLTPTEFQLLALLVSQAGRVVRRKELIEQVWGGKAPHTDRAVDAHIKAIRRKLGAARDCLETVRGIGYRFSDAIAE
jgi:two-component system phosphate regulon response regulator PhoB